MATKLVFAEERQNKILALLKVHNKLLVNDLCQQFAVSPATIRNDLNQMERLGLLKRTHGGAISIPRSGFEPTSTQKIRTNLQQKQRIAEYAATLIENGDTIAIDTGTTTYCLAKLLSGKSDLTVVTTDTQIANLLEQAPSITVILAGGMLRKGFSCTVGSITNQVLSAFQVDKAFLATNAVTPEGDLCTPDIEQAKVKQSLLSMGRQRFLLCDSSKFGGGSFAKFGSVKELDLLITDRELEPDAAQSLRAAGANITLV